MVQSNAAFLSIPPFPIYEITKQTSWHSSHYKSTFPIFYLPLVIPQTYSIFSILTYASNHLRLTTSDTDTALEYI